MFMDGRFRTNLNVFTPFITFLCLISPSLASSPPAPPPARPAGSPPLPHLQGGGEEGAPLQPRPQAALHPAGEAPGPPLALPTEVQAEVEHWPAGLPVHEEHLGEPVLGGHVGGLHPAVQEAAHLLGLQLGGGSRQVAAPDQPPVDAVMDGEEGDEVGVAEVDAGGGEAPGAQDDGAHQDAPVEAALGLGAVVEQPQPGVGGVGGGGGGGAHQGLLHIPNLLDGGVNVKVTKGCEGSQKFLKKYNMLL